MKEPELKYPYTLIKKTPMEHEFTKHWIEAVDSHREMMREEHERMLERIMFPVITTKFPLTQLVMDTEKKKRRLLLL